MRLPGTSRRKPRPVRPAARFTAPPPRQYRAGPRRGGPGGTPHLALPGRRFGRPIRVGDLLLALLVALLTAAVAWTLRSTIVPTDPWHYVHGALEFPDGGWRSAGLSRWGYLLAFIPFAGLWGNAAATFWVIPLISSAALAGVLFLLGTRFVAPVAGLLGALLAMATPLVLANLTRGYPDLTATMLIGLALLLATTAEDLARRGERLWTGWGWQVPALLVACGIVTGWSFEVRETAVFAWPVIAWAVWRVGPLTRTLVWVAPPLVAWAVIDMALSWAVYDDPLLKLRTISAADISASEVTSDAGYVGHSRWWYLLVLPRSIWELTAGPAVLGCLLVGLVGGLVFRDQLGRIWAWGALTLALMWVQGGVLDPAHPSIRLDVGRYWMAFIVPLMLAAAGTIVIALRRSRGRARAVAWAVSLCLVLGILGPSVRFAATYPGFVRNGGTAMAELREELADSPLPPRSRIWADWGTQRVLPVYKSGDLGEPMWDVWRIRSLNRLLKRPPATARGYPRPGDYVLIYSADDRTCWHCRRALGSVTAAFGPFPALGWQTVFRASTGNLTLYRLGPTVLWPASPKGEHDEADGLWRRGDDLTE